MNFMIYLKKINLQDIEEEYKAIISIPINENGFENKYHDFTKNQFEKTIPNIIKYSSSTNCPEGMAPETAYFLWDNDKIVGLFWLRHYLNDFYIKHNAGHIGYSIVPKYRKKGYATAGLKLIIKEASKIVPEDELYLNVYKNNYASLKVQQNCGAYIVGESEDHKYYLTRIKNDKEPLRTK